MDEVRRQTIETLSKGFRRRVGLAQAILHEPRALVLDEPTDGLDPNQKHQVRELIRGLAQERIVIISTHILEEVSALCSRAPGDRRRAAAGGQHAAGAGQPLALPPGGDALQRRPLDTVALAVLPGVAGIEENPAEGSLTVLAQPGAVIFPQVSGLVAERGWRIRELDVERGRLDEVFRNLTRGRRHEATAGDLQARAGELFRHAAGLCSS